jgi:hypothetical protein
MKVDNEKSLEWLCEKGGNGVLVSMAFFDLEEMKQKNQTVEGLDVWKIQCYKEVI